jgi:hypothetical protein
MRFLMFNELSKLLALAKTRYMAKRTLYRMVLVF